MAALLWLFVCGIHISSADAAGLRGQINTQDVESALFTELASNARGGIAQEHIHSLEEALRPMFNVVPREADGSLAHPVVRYVLHRFFVLRHGWFIRGLEPNASASQGNQSLQDLQDWVPAYLQRFIERLQDGRGMNLRELAIIAATLDDLVHKEAVARLEQAFDAIDLSTSTKLDQAKTRQVLEIWMMIYMLGGRFKIRGQKKVMKAHQIFINKIKDWDGVQDWVHELQLKLFPASSNTSLDFNTTVRVVEEVGRTYAEYNRKACQKLKTELVSVESKKAGRVRLTEFYKKGLAGVFDFGEKVDYLRVLGALDESDPNQPYVIVPNYVGSRPNCLVTSTFYVVCCRNECEDLMGTLEQRISKEDGSPEQILQIVPELSTDTTPARRNLSESLVQRLWSVADMHGGVIPLHGRLFGQWMHHAFPRECPYPHGSGVTVPQTADEWMEGSGQADAKASKEEMLAHIESDECGVDECAFGADARKYHDLSENELPWDDSEELLRARGSVEVLLQPEAPSRSSYRGLASLAAVSSFASSVVFLACKYALARARGGKIDVMV
eukprot:CAMPEP_0169105346 /NCGR_PEP_ID=MMETSP1015-20121227/23745_1 /TAXON_ID=342587 /ORGANISM="Karlodinium micrum, Strain CCMP2283" /LENGTH=556 /DNA_ID=CAMNT_0009166695 /DNA_START=1706 /DNA_END=3376 /DNA_ORIENTATION=-